MKLCLQHRSVLLTPPQGMDVLWVSEQFSHPEVVAMFSLADDVRNWHVRTAHRMGTMVLGMIRRVSDGKRVGFVSATVPNPDRDYWELLGAIPNVKHRDGFTMLHAVDTMTCYLFEHRHIAKLGARVRVDNRPPQALIERAGYERGPIETYDGVDHVRYLCEPATWQARRARLDRGEAQHPSGAGGAFVVVSGPPYQPVK